MNARSCLPRLMLSVQTPSGVEGVSLRGGKSFPSLRGAKQRETSEKRKLALCICFHPLSPVHHTDLVAE